MRKRKQKRIIRRSLFVIAVAIISFYIGKYTNQKPKVKDDLPDKFQETYQLIKEEWLNYGQKGNLEEEMLKGMVDALDDPYTEYLSASKANDMSESLQSSIFGIGVLVNQDFVIEQIQANSPAEEVHLLPGDHIEQINHQPLEDIQQLYAFNKDSKIVLTITRNGLKQEYIVPVEKMDATVLYNIISYEQKDYGYLVIRSFGNDTSTSVEKALQYFDQMKVQNIIIDLRDNLGGYVESAIHTLDYFLPKDALLCTLKEKSGNVTEYRSEKDDQYRFVSGYILVNEYTASASEILAGCLQETLDYELVGTKTYGKGIAQDYYTFDDLSVLKYTFATWLLPSGENIQSTGLEVDIEKELDSFRYEAIA